MAFQFVVTHKQPELIAPEKPTPHEIKQVSDIDDQEEFRFHYHIVFFYKNNNHNNYSNDPVKAIRQALGKALVFYYLLAGRLIEGPYSKKLMVDCNSEGVLSTEADAGIELGRLGDTILPPCPYSEQILHGAAMCPDLIGTPLISIQVTRFKCRGFALAFRVNHVICDAFGLLQFLNAIGDIIQGQCTPLVLPVWERGLLNARDSPFVTHRLHAYDEDDKGIINMVDQSQDVTKKSFPFGSKELQALRRHLPSHLGSCSKFDLITACIWTCRTKALQLDMEEVVRLTCFFNLRGKNYLKLPTGYYGNAIINPVAITKAKILCNNSLGYAVELLRQGRAAVTEDYVRSVIDFLATRRPTFSNSCNLIVSDTSSVGFSDVDLGWDKPLYGGTLDGGPSRICVYGGAKNSKGEKVILVPMILPIDAMERFEKELKELIQEQNVNSNKSIASKL